MTQRRQRQHSEDKDFIDRMRGKERSRDEGEGSGRMKASTDAIGPK